MVPSPSANNSAFGSGSGNLDREDPEEVEQEQASGSVLRPPKPPRIIPQSTPQEEEEEVDYRGLGELFRNPQVPPIVNLNSSNMTTTNPLSKLPLKGSGKGPKFPEYVTGISVQDYIEEVEDIVSDVSDIRSDDQKKEALLRYLGSTVKRDWKALEGYEAGSTYDDFRKNILASYDHTETVSIKGLDEMLKSFRHVRVADLDRVLDLKRAMGPHKKELIEKK